MHQFVDPYHPDQPPLPAWASPRKGEPAHGFVVRMAELNDRSSVRLMLIQHGLSCQDLKPDECLAFALSLPFLGKNELVHATPVVSPHGVSLMGQSFRRRQWQIRNRRFCAACIEADPYHRSWWDLKDFRRCPYHDLKIVSCDVNGHAVPWWFPSFTSSPSGDALGCASVLNRLTPRHSPEAYILSRLGVAEPLALPLLDCLPTLGDALDAMRSLGRVVLWGLEEARPAYNFEGIDRTEDVMQAGFALALGGEKAALQVLHRIADSRTASTPGIAKIDCFGWIVARERCITRSNRYDFVNPFLDRVVIERNRSTNILTDHDYSDVSSYLPLPNLAQELNLSIRLLRKISHALGIHEKSCKNSRSRFLQFTENEADLVRRTLRTSVDRTQAAAILGLTRSCFDSIVNADALQPLPGLRKTCGGDRFTLEDIHLFSYKMLAKANFVTEIPNGYVLLSSLERTRTFDPSDVILNFLESSQSSTYAVGLRVGDLIAPSSVYDRSFTADHNASLKMPGLSRSAAASLLGCKSSAIDELLKCGLISTVDVHRTGAAKASTRSRIDRDSVAAFQLTWAHADVYREVLGLKPTCRFVGQALKKADVILHELLIKGKTYKVAFANRESARSRLGLEHDPDSPDSGSITAFEKIVIQALVECRSFNRSGQKSGLSLNSTSGDLGIAIKIDIEKGAGVVWLIRYDTKFATLNEKVKYAREISNGMIETDVTEGILTAKLNLCLPDLAKPDRWPELVERVLCGTELFRTAFPVRKY